MKAFNLQSVFALLLAVGAPLIVASTAAADEAGHVDAVSVFQCAFGEDWDVNYDGWPDRWVRKTGPEHPHYVNIAIQEDPTAPQQKCLRIDLDGAAAAVSSPPIRVSPRFSYIFQAKLKCEAIQHSAVVLTLHFCDANGRVLQTRRTEAYTSTAGWLSVELEPVEPGEAAIDRVVIGLQVQRRHKGDLEGRVSIADVRLARLPRIAVSTNNPANIYTDLDGVIVRCNLSGIPQRDPEIRFQLFDAWKNELQSEAVQLDGQLIVDQSLRTEGVTDGLGQGPNCYEGSTEWRPKIADYGYYRVVVQMLTSGPGGDHDAKRQLASRTIYLAVVPPLTMPRRGEFGWTLPAGQQPLSFQDLSRLLPQVGINWLKVPVWFDAGDSQRGDELIRFVELLGASNIEVVGIIDHPAASPESSGRPGRSIPVAELLSLDSTAWAPSLEPVMARLSLRVRWWQLGREYDTSFVGFPALHKRIEELRRTLFRFGQDVRLGLSWDWNSSELLSGQAAPWDFQQFCLESPPTEKKFEKLLAKPRENEALRWVFVEPPPPDAGTRRMNEEAIDARSSEFVRRLVAAKVHGADAIIVPRPFDDENGLMRASGMPADLLLPWRTTAVMLAGADYLGQMQLPSRSQNRIFLRPDGQVVMVVWNNAPAQEVLYLGNDVRQIDILGRTTTPERRGREQVIHVRPTPSFVLGLNEAVTRWQMSVSLQKRQVPSIFKTPHPNAIRFQNFFPQGVGGSLKIVVLQARGAGEQMGRDANALDSSSFTHDRWTIEPPQASFQLAAGQAREFPFEIRLKNALFGKQPVRIDFKVEAEETFEFSVYREMEVGTEDLTLEVDTHLEKDGTLIVEQLMTNSAEQLTDLKCHLYAKGRRPERMQVYRLGPSVDRKVYRFPDGAQLVGNEMLLEIEELNGPRVLRYRFVAKAQSDKPQHAKAQGGASSAAEGEKNATGHARLADFQP
jgi:hypothetical protein